MYSTATFLSDICSLNIHSTNTVHNTRKTEVTITQRYPLTHTHKKKKSDMVPTKLQFSDYIGKYR